MVFELLKTGKENARRSADLAACLDIDRRKIASLVEKERRSGKPICATTNHFAPGYYIAATREEMQAYCGRLRRRAGEIFKTRAACLKTLEDLPPADPAMDGNKLEGVATKNNNLERGI